MNNCRVSRSGILQDPACINNKRSPAGFAFTLLYWWSGRSLPNAKSSNTWTLTEWQNAGAWTRFTKGWVNFCQLRSGSSTEEDFACSSDDRDTWRGSWQVPLVNWWWWLHLGILFPNKRGVWKCHWSFQVQAVSLVFWDWLSRVAQCPSVSHNVFWQYSSTGFSVCIVHISIQLTVVVALKSREIFLIWSNF